MKECKDITEVEKLKVENYQLKLAASKQQYLMLKAENEVYIKKIMKNYYPDAGEKDDLNIDLNQNKIYWTKEQKD